MAVITNTSKLTVKQLTQIYELENKSNNSSQIVDRQILCHLLTKMLDGSYSAYGIFLIYLDESQAIKQQTYLLYILSHFLDNPIAICAMAWIYDDLVNDPNDQFDISILTPLLSKDCVYALHFCGNSLSHKFIAPENPYLLRAGKLGFGLATTFLATQIEQYNDSITADLLVRAIETKNFTATVEHLIKHPPNNDLYDIKINLLLKAEEQKDQLVCLYLGDHYSLLKCPDLAKLYYQKYLYWIENWASILPDNMNEINRIINSIEINL